jgi:Zn-dependent peptidase ImmA (M78 family)
MKPPAFEIGDRDRIAVRIAFESDPDKGRGASKDESVSWGSLQLWVEGKNLCQYQYGQQVHQEVKWYLLPILEWLVEQWNPILHEERFPGTTRYADARSGYENAVIPRLAIFDENTGRLQEAWEEWWGRHALHSQRDGGILPDLFIRRWRDSVEFSWGNSAVPGTPKDFSFLCPPSMARISVAEVAKVLYAAVERASSYLVTTHEQSQRPRNLKNALSAITHTSPAERDAWLVRLGSDLEDSKESLMAAFDAIKTRATEVIDAVLTSTFNELAVTEESHAVLMFGTVAPNVTRKDVRKLAISIADAYNGTGDTAGLCHHVKSVPLTSTTRPYAHGYELAMDFIEGLPGRNVEETPDIEHLTNKLNIATGEVDLEDETIRGVTIAGPQHTPTILVNRSSGWNTSPSGRRFTIAHEMCHLLYDRAYGRRLSMASGPWAPRDVEQRANAFAAMLLMPIASINQTIRKLDVPLATVEGVRAIAELHQTSPVATLEHLYNLHKLDDADREMLRAEFDARVANSGPPLTDPRPRTKPSK